MLIGAGKTMIKKVGVLSLQGAVIEHITMLKQLPTIVPVEVKSKNDILKIDGLILPGGESTTIGNLLKKFDLHNIINQRIKKGMPVWGTCAGMILLAKEIENQDSNHLGVMDFKVKRNGYGAQLDSFVTNTYVSLLNKNLDLVFIRAPYVVSHKDSVNVLCTVNGKIVAVRQDNMLATAFHPELTPEIDFHRYFVNDFILK